MKKYTVLAVHNRYKIPGGEDSVFENEIKMLEENGHRVIRYERDNSELERLSFFGKLFLPFSSVFSFKTYREIKRIIRKEHVDIVHVHNTLTLISPSVYYAAVKCGTPLVKTLHNFRLICPSGTLCRNGEICEDCISHGMKNSVKHRCYRGSFAQTLLLRNMISIHRGLGIYRKINYIALTDFNRDKMLSADPKHKMFIPEKMFVKPNFSPVCLPPPVKTARKRQLVFAARLDMLKGIDTLLEAFLQVKEYDLLIYGDGPLFEECKTFITSHKMNNVHLMGRVNNSELLPVIAESAALVLPTKWYEGFPVSIVESLSVGTPVITSDIGNPGNIIENGITGFKFTPGSSDSLREAIVRLSCAPDSIFDSAYETYLKKYSREKSYSELMNIYERISV